MILTDARILPCLCVLHVVLFCFQANFAKQFVPEITDSSWRNSTDFCFFFSFFAVRSAKIKNCRSCSRLTVDVKTSAKMLTTWSVVSYVDGLRTEPIFVTALARYSEPNCREFLKTQNGTVFWILAWPQFWGVSPLMWSCRETRLILWSCSRSFGMQSVEWAAECFGSGRGEQWVQIFPSRSATSESSGSVVDLRLLQFFA